MADLALLVGQVANRTQLVRVLAVLRERVGEVGGAHAGRLLCHCVLLLQHVLLLADLPKPWVLQRLRRRYPIVRVVDKQFLDEVDDFRAGLGDELGDTGALDPSHAELREVHVAGVPLELVEQLLVGRAQDVMDLVHLVELVVPREQREERDNFEHDAAHAPQVHLVPVVAVRQEALGRSVPARRDVFRVGLLAVDASTAAEVGQLDLVLHQKDVLRLDVPVENAVTVHVVNGLHQLVHVVLDALLRQVVPATLDRIVHVHLHELEHERQPPSRLVVEHLVELDNLRVGRQTPQCLDLTQVIDL